MTQTTTTTTTTTASINNKLLRCARKTTKQLLHKLRPVFHPRSLAE